MKKKLFVLALLTATSAFAAPISTPVNVSDTPIIGGSNGSCGTVDLTNATSDYNLQPCETAVIRFNNATMVPLHIATQDGTYYEMDIVPSNPIDSGVARLVYLYPNNTVYPNAFTFVSIWNDEVINFGYSQANSSAFVIGDGIASSKGYIINFTTNKNIKVFNSEDLGTNYRLVTITISCFWKDTTTPWTSIGTIVFPQLTSGYVLVKRIY